MGSPAPRRLSALTVGLVGLLVLLTGASLCLGPAGNFRVGEMLQGLAARFGRAQALPDYGQALVGLRLYRTLTAIGVGAALALSGALLQGVFRNDLASPSLLGVSSGASLGAALAILALGGYGPLIGLTELAPGGALFVTAAAFIGAGLTTLLVTSLGTTGGRVSVPTLLLVGIAVNSLLGGALAAIQSFVLDDLDLARALFAWSFGSLDDHSGTHLALLFGALAFAALSIPFIASELDLFVAGEEDAESLGVPTARVKALALLAASLAAGAAVAVAGQIAFLGLVVPHILRITLGRSHRRLLPMTLVGGPLILLFCDVGQRLVASHAPLPPGVLMSLAGGPFFLLLLLRQRRRIQAW